MVRHDPETNSCDCGHARNKSRNRPALGWAADATLVCAPKESLRLRPPEVRLLAAWGWIDRARFPGARHPRRLGDWTVPDRHQRRRPNPVGPLFCRRPALAVLGPGSDLQPSAAVLRRAPEQLVPAGRASSGHVALGRRDGNARRYPVSRRFELAKRIARVDADAWPDARAHSKRDAYTSANPVTDG